MSEGEAGRARAGRRGRLSCLLAAVSLVAACTGDAGSGKAPLVRPFTVEKEPVWVGSTNLVSAGRLPELRGDSLIVYGPGKEQSERDRALAVLDVATGRPRWRLDAGKLTEAGHDTVDARPEKVLPADASNGRDWMVIAPYQACGTRPGCVPDPGDPAEGQNGIVALAGADGRVRWKTPLDPERRVGYLTTGDDVTISLLLRPGAANERLNGSLAVAVNAADGTIRWESAGVWPVFVAGDTVLAIEADRVAPLEPTVTQEATVVALDAETGARKWDLSDRYARSNLLQTLGDVAVIGTADERGGNQRSRVIDAHTGRELADLGGPLWCNTDQESLLTCVAERGRDLTVFDVDRREKSVLRGVVPPRRGGIIPVRGYLFRDDDVIDRAGTVVSDEPLGFVVGMSDQYLVTFPDRTGDEPDKLAVYRIER